MPPTKEESELEAPRYGSLKPLKADFDSFEQFQAQMQADKTELFAAQQLWWDRASAKQRLEMLRNVRERGIEIGEKVAS